MPRRALAGQNGRMARNGPASRPGDRRASAAAMINYRRACVPRLGRCRAADGEDLGGRAWRIVPQLRPPQSWICLSVFASRLAPPPRLSSLPLMSTLSACLFAFPPPDPRPPLFARLVPGDGDIGQCTSSVPAGRPWPVRGRASPGCAPLCARPLADWAASMAAVVCAFPVRVPDEARGPPPPASMAAVVCAFPACISPRSAAALLPPARKTPRPHASAAMSSRCPCPRLLRQLECAPKAATSCDVRAWPRLHLATIVGTLPCTAPAAAIPGAERARCAQNHAPCRNCAAGPAVAVATATAATLVAVPQSVRGCAATAWPGTIPCTLRSAISYRR